MKSVKTFLKINTYADKSDAIANEVFFIKDDLFFKNQNNDVFKISSHKLYNQYGLIYGLRMKVYDGQPISEMTSNKLERVLIIRSITKDFEYDDFILTGSDTGMHFNIGGFLNNEYPVDENISKFYPFSEMRRVNFSYRNIIIEMPFVKIPIFYKNKYIEFYPDKTWVDPETENTYIYIYYLISKFCFDDFEPSEAFVDPDGNLCKTIAISQTKQEMDFKLEFDTEYDEGDIDGHSISIYNPIAIPINEPVYADCLYYLNFIKTASYTPFKDYFSENHYTFLSSESTSDLSDAIQEDVFTGGGNLKSITLSNISSSNFFENEPVSAIIGIDSDTYSTARSFKDFINNPPVDQKYYNVTGTIEIISSTECSFKLNQSLSNYSSSGEKFFIFFMKQLNTEFVFDDRNRIVVDGCRCTVCTDWLVDIVPFAYSSYNSIFEVPSNQNTNLATINAITSSNVDQFLTPAYHMCTPVITYTSLNSIYPQTNWTQNIHRIYNNYNQDYYFNNNLNLYSELTSIGRSNSDNYYLWNNSIAYEENTDFYFGYYNGDIVGEFDSVIDVISNGETRPFLTFCFLCVENINSETDEPIFGWHKRTYHTLYNSMFNALSSSVTSDNWHPDYIDGVCNTVYTKNILTRYIMYCNWD